MDSVQSPARRFSEVLDKLLELKKVYEVNSTLMKKRDEEIGELKLELAACKKQLATVELELKNSKRNFESEPKFEMNDLLQRTQVEFKEALTLIEEKCDEIRNIEWLNCKLSAELCFAKEKFHEHAAQIAELEILLLKTRRELEKSQEECREKSDHIAVMGDLILNYNYDHESENEEQLTDDIFTGSLSQTESKLALSSIPEENIDEIPDYYDICRSYSESLKFSIGSDSKIFEEDSEINESKSETKFLKHGANAKVELKVKSTTKPKSGKLKSAVSAASANSDKENSKVPVNTKKRRFKKLFSFGISNSTL